MTLEKMLDILKTFDFKIHCINNCHMVESFFTRDGKTFSELLEIDEKSYEIEDLPLFSWLGYDSSYDMMRDYKHEKRVREYQKKHGLPKNYPVSMSELVRG